MADKKVTPPLGAFPGAPPQPQASPYLPAPPQHAAPQYGVFPPTSPYGAALVNAAAGSQMYSPAPPYDLHHHQPINIGQQMYSPAMYAAAAAAAGYPGYIGYPVQYYPYYPTMQPSIQPLRPTIMIPNGFEAAGGRLDGMGAPLLPPGPAAPLPPPHLAAATAAHQVLWR